MINDFPLSQMRVWSGRVVLCLLLLLATWPATRNAFGDTERAPRPASTQVSTQGRVAAKRAASLKAQTPQTRRVALGSPSPRQRHAVGGYTPATGLSIVFDNTLYQPGQSAGATVTLAASGTAQRTVTVRSDPAGQGSISAADSSFQLAPGAQREITITMPATAGRYTFVASSPGVTSGRALVEVALVEVALPTRPTWDASPQIGHNQPTTGPNAGQLVPDGRMISPQDQRVAFSSTTEVPVAPGASVGCEVEGATDLDTRTATDGTTSEASSNVSYRWEAVGGGAGGGTGEWSWQEGQTTRRGASAPTRVATWTAPADITEETTFTLQCTIDDVEGAIAAGETGDREDEEIVRTVTVKISTATVLLDLLRKTEEATATEAARYTSSGSSAIGGQVYGALYLTVGQGLRVSSSNALVRLEERPDEENHVDHPFNEDRVDIGVNFNQATGWQKYYDPAGAQELGWWPSPEAPSAATSSERAVRYRYLLGWNTAIETPGTYFNGAETVAGKLLGHNGAHRMSLRAVDGNGAAQVAFTSGAGGSSLAPKPEDKEATIGNLIITEVSTSNGTSDYFKFDPANPELGFVNPTISFTVKDDGDKNQYRWRVRVRSTDMEATADSVVYTGLLSQPGTVSATINQSSLASDSPQMELTEAGTYNFEISVAEIKGETQVDYMDLRSKVVVPYNMAAPNAALLGHDGWFTDNADESTTWRMNYYFQDADLLYASGRKATLKQVNFDVLNPKFERIGGKSSATDGLPTQVNVAHLGANSEGIGVFTFPAEDTPESLEAEAVDNPYISVLTAQDDYAAFYRDHKPRSILAKNNRTAEVGSSEFTSDHKTLYNQSRTFGGEIGAKIVAPHNYQDTATKRWITRPITHTRNQKLQMKVNIKASKAGLRLKLTGRTNAGEAFFSFDSAEFMSTGKWQAISITANDELPNRLDVYDPKILWKVTEIGGKTISQAKKRAYKIYGLWGTPIQIGSYGGANVPTIKRLDELFTVLEKAKINQGDIHSIAAIIQGWRDETVAVSGGQDNVSPEFGGITNAGMFWDLVDRTKERALCPRCRAHGGHHECLRCSCDLRTYLCFQHYSRSSRVFNHTASWLHFARHRI